MRSQWCRSGVVALVVGLSAVAVADGATVIQVAPDLDSRANLVVEFADGASYHFDVGIPSNTTGLGLFDLVEAATTLTTVRADFGFGEFIDGISYEGHSNSGFGGGENWWHYWTADEPSAVFAESWIGAGDRVVADGSWDGWVYGTAVAPVPEPAFAGLTLIGLACGLMRRR